MANYRLASWTQRPHHEGPALLDEHRRERVGGITHVSLLPHFLKGLLEVPPADFVKPAERTIGTSGSLLSDELECVRPQGPGDGGDGLLRQQRGWRHRFQAEHTLGQLRDGLPGVEVGVVDEARRPMPRGEAGRLRIRSESMALSYLDDPERRVAFSGTAGSIRMTLRSWTDRGASRSSAAPTR